MEKISYTIFLKSALVRKRTPGPLPSFLRRPPLDPNFPLLFKIFVSSPLFSVAPTFKVFQRVPHPHKTPFCHNLTHQLSLHMINSLQKYLKSDLTSSTAAFCQKSIFDFLYPFKNILVYLNLWEISGSFLDNLRMTFLHKVMVAKKRTFLKMPNTILQKIISKCKNDKPWKI